jgi:hypothetical protein
MARSHGRGGLGTGEVPLLICDGLGGLGTGDVPLLSVEISGLPERG